jgi:hypothetical protein
MMISGGGNSITSETRSQTRATARRGSIHKSIADPPPALRGEEQQPSDAANAVHAIGTGAAIALARVNMTQAFGVHMIPMVMRCDQAAETYMTPKGRSFMEFLKRRLSSSPR